MHRLIGYHTAIFQIPQESYWFKSERITSKAKREILSILNILHLFHADAFLEKTPSHFGSLDLIQSIFPKAKFIFMFRDPRDVAASLKARGSTLERACAEWNRAAQSFAVSFKKDSVISVRLEDLLQNPVYKTEQIQRFIGLEPEDLVSRHAAIPRRFYSRDSNRPSTVEDGKNHNTNRNWQINQPLFSDSKRWHKDLSSCQASFVIKSTLSCAKLVGYSLD
jgi:hypothetical protein